MNDWHQAEQFADDAYRHFEAGQWNMALEALKRALAVNPDQAEWHLGMGLTLDAMQRYADAAASFDKVIELRGEDGPTLLHLGSALLNCHRDRRAVEVLKRVTAIDRECESAYCHLILAYGRLGMHDEAEQAFYMARQIVDQCPMCYDHIAQSLLARGRSDKAMWCWQQVRKIDSNYPDIHARLAKVYWHDGKLEKARQLYLTQLRDDPGDTESMIELGRLLIQMGRPTDAAQKFRHTLELNSSSAPAHQHLGEIAFASNHLDAAQREWHVAAKLDPEAAGPHLGLAKIAIRRRQHDEAIQLLDDEVARTDRTPRQQIELAEALLETRQPSEAMDLLEPMLQHWDATGLDNTMRSTALNLRAVAHIFKGWYGRALGDCRMAVQFNPANGLAMFNLVLALVELGQLRRATYWLNLALQLNPDSPTLRQMKLRIWRDRVIGRFIRTFDCVTQLFVKKSKPSGRLKAKGRKSKVSGSKSVT